MNRKKQMFEFTLTSIFGAIILLLSLVPNLGFITVLPGVSITIVHIPVIIGVFILGLKGGFVLGLFFGIGSLLASLIYAKTAFDLAFIYPWVSVLPRILFGLLAHYIVKGLKTLENLKFGKVILLSLVSIITALSLFFGVKATTQKVVYSKHDELNIEYLTKENLTEVEKQEYIVNIAELKESADIKYKQVRKIVIPITIIVIIGFIGLYYYMIMIKYNNKASVSTSFILATIAHTILVILAIAIFNPNTFSETFGSNNNLITIVLMIALTNGLIEALFASIIGTPVAIALLNRMEDDE